MNDYILKDYILRLLSHNLTHFFRYIMKRVSKTNPFVKCSEIDTFSFRPWKESKMGKVSVNGNDGMNVKSIKH